MRSARRRAQPPHSRPSFVFFIFPPFLSSCLRYWHLPTAPLTIVWHQGSFGLGLRISYTKTDGTQEYFVVKRNDIVATGYKSILREKAFMHALHHPNIVKLHYQCVSPNYPTGEDDDTTVFFVMEDGTSFINPDKRSWRRDGATLRE